MRLNRQTDKGQIWVDVLSYDSSEPETSKPRILVLEVTGRVADIDSSFRLYFPKLEEKENLEIEIKGGKLDYNWLNNK